ncbi:dihydrodipicolinate synthetase [Durotheca rogersii]|uniref:dihydrodipicolinate synthetase n=1 Tax=Durotheca rogersii TaxID=419775 RepID=UPI00221F10ED|nr:dihydrodipicolinate synthetase [Durotheca rogersii]KAI5866246.1 dihydrodipicolinate synthetase [Durotheca rogersii]
MAPHVYVSSPAGNFAASFPGDSLWPTTSEPKTSRPPPIESHPSPNGSIGCCPTERSFRAARPLRAGVYVPTVCFFDQETEDVDIDTIARHAVRLAEAGVAGIATQGSNGEAVHLTHAEREQVTSTTRKALDNAGFSHIPVVVGCGAQSTRETIQYCCEAWEAGGDYALVLPPSYYAASFAPSSKTIIEYFSTVANISPIPIIIYNFPSAANGLDLTSDIILHLARHPKIVGVKLTCGNTGKLNRIAAVVQKRTKAYDPERPDFLVLAGSADFSIQSLIAGGHGVLAGLANIAPKTCIKTIELYKAGRHPEAQKMQETLSHADWIAIQGGVICVKAGLQGWMGYGGYMRRPLPKPTIEQAKSWKEGFRELVLLEESL